MRNNSNTFEDYELSMEGKWRSDTKRAYNTILSMGDRVKTITEDEVLEILEGAVDIHVHAAPDPEIDVGWDQIEIAEKATDIGMGAVVYKAHTIPTAATAFYVQKAIDKYARDIEKKPVKVFGGVTLNYYQGGLNPEAVQMCADLGGKVVWLPSHSSAHHRRVMGESGGIELLDDSGRPVPELYEIFKIIAENDMILDPCHAGTKQRFTVIREAKKIGVKKIMITHPNWNVTKATHEQMVEMGKMGAYIGLFMYGDVPNFNNPNCDPNEMFEIIKKVGPEHIVLASDLGTVINMPPWEGMKLFVRILLANGIARNDIEKMCRDNSASLLGLA
jgi:predicted TIM-barrel fold metal-dependent hydrolase